MLLFSTICLVRPPAFSVLANRARLSANQRAATTDPSFEPGFHDLTSIRFHLASALFTLNSAEVLGVASEGNFLAIIPSPTSTAFFKSSPVYANSTDQTFFLLQNKVFETANVLVFATKQLSFREVFTNLTFGTCLSHNHSESSFPVTFQWNETAEPQPIQNTSSQVRLGYSANISLSVFGKVNSGFDLRTFFAVDATSVIGFQLEAGSHSFQNLQFPEMKTRIPLKIPTSVSVAGIEIAFNVYAIGRSSVSALSGQLPGELEYSREVNASLDMYGRISNSLQNYTHFEANSPQFSSSVRSSLPDWSDQFESGSLAFTPHIRIGLAVELLLGGEKLEQEFGFDIAAGMEFAVNKAQCNFPSLSGSLGFVADWYYRIDPSQLINFVLPNLADRWSFVLDSLAGLSLPQELRNFVNNLKSLVQNREPRFRLWTSPPVEGCLFLRPESRETAPDGRSEGSRAFLSFPIALSRVDDRAVPVSVKSGETHQTIGASFPPFGFGFRPFYVASVDPQSTYQYRFNGALLPSQSFPGSSVRRNTSASFGSILTRDLVGRSVPLFAEFPLDPNATFYSFAPVPGDSAHDYVMITNTGGYGVPFEGLRGFDIAAVGLKETQPGFYRRSHPVTATFDSISQNISSDVTTQLTLLRCPAGATKLTLDCLPLATFRFNLAQRQEEYLANPRDTTDHV
jgi:hypothetical protein